MVLCWAKDPNQRPSFGEIVAYLKEDCGKQVWGNAVGAGTSGRRRSAEGDKMHQRMLEQQLQEEKEKGEEEDKMKDHGYVLGKLKEVSKENEALKIRMEKMTGVKEGRRASSARFLEGGIPGEVN